MKSSFSFKNLLFILLFCQLLYTTFISFNHIFFNSGLRLWANQDYSYDQKVQMILGGDYMLAKQLSFLPEDANLFLLENPPYFLNYYISPRKVILNDAYKNVQDIKKDWLKSKNIDAVIYISPPKAGMLKVDRKTGEYIK